MRPLFAFLFVLLLAGCGSARLSGGGTSSSLECVPFARQRTGLQLYGDAAGWWDQADGRYGRTSSPVPGSALVFRRSARLPHGHVAVVRSQTSPREIRVDQANWIHHRITAGEPVIDVSDANDWSRVRVWWDPAGALGATTYSTYGFVVP